MWNFNLSSDAVFDILMSQLAPDFLLSIHTTQDDIRNLTMQLSEDHNKKWVRYALSAACIVFVCEPVWLFMLSARPDGLFPGN